MRGSEEGKGLSNLSILKRRIESRWRLKGRNQKMIERLYLSIYKDCNESMLFNVADFSFFLNSN